MTLKQANIATCTVLAGLTLAVFAAAQSAGPESTVRRYLAALGSNDAARMQTLITTPIESPYNIWLVNASRAVVGAPMRAKGKERSGNLVLVATDHDRTMMTVRGPEKMVSTIFWVLVRTNGQWRIDPVRTYQFREQSTSFRR